MDNCGTTPDKGRHPNIYLRNPSSAENSSKKFGTTKGVAMSFGFRRPQHQETPSTKPPEIIDRNGNGTVRGTIINKLTTQQQEPTIRRLNNYRPNLNRPNSAALPTTNYVQHAEQGRNNINNRFKTPKTNNQFLNNNRQSSVDTNKNYNKRSASQQEIHPSNGTSYLQDANKFTVQSKQLVKPQYPMTRLPELKDAKTLLNNNRKINQHQATSSSKVQQQQRFVQSNQASPSDPESNLEFDLCIRDELVAPIDSLPLLPSAFQDVNTQNLRHGKAVKATMTTSHSKQLSALSNLSNIRTTHFKPKTDSRHETPLEPTPSKKSFLKTKPKPEDSEDYEWMPHAGDALAEDCSLSLTLSNDTTLVSEPQHHHHKPKKPDTLVWASLATTSTKRPVRASSSSVLLNIEDPMFAAVAEAGNTEPLLEDEPCPIDNILTCSESEDKHCRFPSSEPPLDNSSSSTYNSKDVNEKESNSTTKDSITVSTPASPTNDSLSLSDSKDYFDDEIADQPALIFDDTLTSVNEPVPVEISETSMTVVDSTTATMPAPKHHRKPSAIEGSPLFLRRKLNSCGIGSRTGSTDTLSPCDSITSDDLMLDFDQQSQDEKLDSDVESVEKPGGIEDFLRECSSLIEASSKNSSSTPLLNRHHARLLRSRTSRSNSPANSSLSPARRLSRPTLLGDQQQQHYGSDDSLVGDSLAAQQDVMQIKTMLLKLKRTLNQSENFVPIDQPVMKNDGASEHELKMMVAELKRQIQYLQDQLEDREQAVVELEKKMQIEKQKQQQQQQQQRQSSPDYLFIATAPLEIPKSNAATQTDRVRPLSTSSSLIQMSPTDSGMSSLVSSTKSHSRRNVYSIDDDRPVNFFVNKPFLMYPIGIL